MCIIHVWSACVCHTTVKATYVLFYLLFCSWLIDWLNQRQKCQNCQLSPDDRKLHCCLERWTLQPYVIKDRLNNDYSVSQKMPPLRFSDIFSKRLGIFNQFLHTYYMFISTLDCKFVFCIQLSPPLTKLCHTKRDQNRTHRIFDIALDLNL